MKLKSIDSYIVKGRGTVYTIDLVENGLPQTRAEWYPLLMRKVVQIDGKYHVVHGIESFMPGEPFKHKTIGLLVTMQASKPVRENTLP